MTLGGRVSKCPPVASLLHVTAGIAGARPLEASRRFSWRAALALTALSLVADVDVLAFRFGIPYSDPFGHRGATHSLVFAVLAGTVTALVLSHGGGGIVTNGPIRFCTRGERLVFYPPPAAHREPGPPRPRPPCQGLIPV